MVSDAKALAEQRTLEDLQIRLDASSGKALGLMPSSGPRPKIARKGKRRPPSDTDKILAGLQKVLCRAGKPKKIAAGLDDWLTLAASFLTQHPYVVAVTILAILVKRGLPRFCRLKLAR